MPTLASILIGSAVVTIALSIAWLFTARRIIMLLDHVKTAHVASLPVTYFENDGQYLIIGKQLLDLRMTDDRRFELHEWSEAPEPGDHLSLVLKRSLLSWRTIEFNFMTGHSPVRRRHLYYRLVWKKPNGATLKMVWRYEECFYAVDGWTGNASTRKGSTGIIYARLIK